MEEGESYVQEIIQIWQMITMGGFPTLIITTSNLPIEKLIIKIIS